MSTPEDASQSVHPSDPDQIDIFACHSPELYVQQMTQLMGLSIPAEQFASVVENFRRVQAIAQPVLDFPLPDTLEAAPRFEP